MENDNQLGKDKGNGGEERRRHMQHYSKWSRDIKCEDNEVFRSHVRDHVKQR